MINSKIAALSVYLPERLVTNEEIEDRVNARGLLLPPGSLERLFGNRTRHYAAPGEQTSDLAAQAAASILQTTPRGDIDFLIFAAASSDLLEPATANIVQQKLGLRCPAMDIKNACNSFISALMTADAFVQSGMYRNILITTGERLSSVVNYEIEDAAHLRRALASFSLGDAGAAALVTVAEPHNGLRAQAHLNLGEYWDLCTVKGGGSMFIHDATKNFFEGKTKELATVIQREAIGFFEDFFSRNGLTPNDFDHIIAHQVSLSTFKTIAEGTGLPEARMVKTFHCYGNTAAASIPLALQAARESGRLKTGDKVLLVGLAAGVSLGLQYLIW